MGVICFILPYTRTYVWFAIVAFIYGLLTGGLSFIGPIIFQENIPEKQVPFAIGLGNFFVGVTGFLRPPFIGELECPIIETPKGIAPMEIELAELESAD